MAETYSIEHIREKALGLIQEPVSPNEVEFARTLLKNGSGDIYGALSVVGICGQSSDAALIEKYVHGAENNIYAEEALKALCRHMGLIDQYRSLIRSYIMQPVHDDGSRRMAAINLCSEYFSNFKDDELGCKLLGILSDFGDSNRRSARNALVNILQIQSELDDPYGITFDNWGEDETKIFQSACRLFGCSNIIMANLPQSH